MFKLEMLGDGILYRTSFYSSFDYFTCKYRCSCLQHQNFQDNFLVYFPKEYDRLMLNKVKSYKTCTILVNYGSSTFCRPSRFPYEKFVPALALEYKLYFSRKSDRKSEVYRCTVRYRLTQNSAVANCTESDRQTCGLRRMSHTVGTVCALKCLIFGGNQKLQSVKTTVYDFTHSP